MSLDDKIDLIEDYIKFNNNEYTDFLTFLLSLERCSICSSDKFKKEINKEIEYHFKNIKENFIIKEEEEIFTQKIKTKKFYHLSELESNDK